MLIIHKCIHCSFFFFPLKYSLDFYQPIFYCNQTTAIIIYDKYYNPDLNSSMIRLDQDLLPIECQYHVDDNTTHIIAYVPLVGCGGSLTLVS